MPITSDEATLAGTESCVGGEIDGVIPITAGGLVVPVVGSRPTDIYRLAGNCIRRSEDRGDLQIAWRRHGNLHQPRILITVDIATPDSRSSGQEVSVHDCHRVPVSRSDALRHRKLLTVRITLTG